MKKSEKKNNSSKFTEDWLPINNIVNGTIVSIGSHPAGIVVSPIPIDKYLGVCSLNGNNNPVCCVDMKVVDGLNYIKLAILG